MAGPWLISYLALWVLVLLLVVIVLGVVRQLGLVYARIGTDDAMLTTSGALLPGTPVPFFR